MLPVKENIYVLELPGKGPMLALDTADPDKRRVFVASCRRSIKSLEEEGFHGFFQIGSHLDVGLAAWEIWGDPPAATIQGLLDRVRRELSEAGYPEV